MKDLTLTQIKKEVLANGGSLVKAKHLLNGNDAYYVNDKLLTKSQVIESYKLGEL